MPTSSGTRRFTEAERELTRRWLDQWKTAGPVLEAERIAALRGLDEAGAARIASDMLWPLAAPGGGDDGAALLGMSAALRRLAEQR
jgi:hypothetical protein